MYQLYRQQDMNIEESIKRHSSFFYFLFLQIEQKSVKKQVGKINSREPFNVNYEWYRLNFQKKKRKSTTNKFEGYRT